MSTTAAPGSVVLVRDEEWLVSLKGLRTEADDTSDREADMRHAYARVERRLAAHKES